MMKCPLKITFGYIYRSIIKMFAINLAELNVNISANSRNLVLNITQFVAHVIIHR